jgi:hypothetical protein
MRDCYNEIMRQLKLTWIFKWDYTPTYDQIQQRDSIEKQVAEQYDCNRREIIFSITT